MLYTLPNLLSMSRILVLAPLAWLMLGGADLAAAILFAAAAVTDFFDGRLARSRDEVSRFGKALDSIADKVLVAGTLILLASLGRLEEGVIAAVIIVAREFIVSGLRVSMAGGTESPLEATLPAKAKTVFQMASVTLLTASPAMPGLGATLAHAGIVLLWVAALLSLVSAGDYARKAWAFLR